MKKKILFFCFLVFMMLMITPFTSAISITGEQKNFILKSKEYIDLNYENTTIYQINILGPINSTISEITYQNGTFQNKSMFLFNRFYTILCRFLSLPFIFLRLIAFYVKDKIDFTVEYKQDIPPDSNTAYITNITEWVNGKATNNTFQIINEKHTIKIEGFFGALFLIKKNRLIGPTFVISGFCEKYTIIK